MPAPKLVTTARRLLRALVSAAALAVLLAGLPLALWAFGPHPTALPSARHAESWLTSPDDGHLLLGLFSVAAWLLWAAFTLSLLLEVAALLRHRAAPAVRGMHGLQEITATLVGAIIVLAPAGTALAATPSATPSATATATPATSTPPTASGPTAPATSAVTSNPTTASTPAGQGPTFTITKPGATWWQIAADTLGDGARWQEIASLNPQLSADHLPIGTLVQLPPGARLPAAADTPATATATPDSPPPTAGPVTAPAVPQHPAAGPAEVHHPRSYTVRPGDTLSQIAERELGNSARYPEVFRLNAGEALPHGGEFRDPDLIIPGQHLDLPHHTTPAQPRPAQRHPARPQPNSTRPKPGSTPTHTAPAAGTTPQAATPGHTADGSHRDAASPPLTTAPRSTPQDTARRDAPQGESGGTGQPGGPAAPGSEQASPKAVPSPGPTSPAARPPAQPTTTDGRTAPNTPVTSAPATAPQATAGNSSREEAWAGGVAALLAAALVGVLGLRRILQHRARRAGQTIAVEEATSLERAITATGEPETVERLDLALRTMAALASASGAELPVVRGAFVTGTALGVIVDDTGTAALPPFTASAEPGRWVLDRDAELLPVQASPAVAPPYPSLVSLGTTENGHLLLANFTESPVILLAGAPDEVLEITRAMALEAASIAWSAAEVFTVGLGGRLPQLLPHGRLRAMNHLGAAVADLASLLLEAAQDGAGVDVLPWMLVASADAEAEELWSLADAVSASAAVRVSVILSDSEPARRAFPDALVLDAARGAAAAFPALGPDGIRLQRMTDAEYRQLLHALDVADAPARPADGPWKGAISHDVPATTPAAAVRPRLVPNPSPADPAAEEPGDHDTGPAFPAEGAAAAQPFPALVSRAVRLAAEPDAPGSEGPSGGSRPDEGRDPADVDQSAAHGLDSPAGPDDPRGGDGGEDTDPPAPTAPKQAADAPQHEEVEDTGDAFTDLPELTRHDHVVRVLGPVEVAGTAHLGQRNNVIPLAALVALRPGLTTEQLCESMSPYEPWAVSTLRQRLAELRTTLPSTDDSPALPRPRPGGGYRFTDRITCDWDTFQHLAVHGLGPGRYRIQALEGALALVAGRPLDAPYPWAVALRQEMIARIVDVAHHLAVLHAQGAEPDFDAARQSVEKGLLADVTAEVLYRDLMSIENAAGHLLGLRHAVTRCRAAARFHGLEVEPETERTIARLLGDPSAAPKNSRTVAR